MPETHPEFGQGNVLWGFSEIWEAIVSLPRPAQVAVGIVLVTWVLTLARNILNTFTGMHPPIFEGLPFIGGLLKFTRVRASQLMSATTAAA